MQNIQTGNLLVASTLTSNPIYAGGVCLIVHQDDEQTIGVMLNRPLQPSPEAIAALLANTQNDEIEAAEMEFDSLGNQDFGEQGYPGDVDEYEPETFEAEDFSESWEEGELDQDQYNEVEFDPAAATSGGKHLNINRVKPLMDETNSPAGGISVPPANPDGLSIDASGLTPLGQLHFGGPVSGPVVALHSSSELAEMEPSVGIYVAAQRDHLEQLFREQSDRFRLIVGHLRWAPGALESEMEAGMWHSLPATAEQVFAPAAGMWPRLIRRGASKSLAKWIGVDDLVNAAAWN